MRLFGRSMLAFVLILTALVMPGAAWAQGGTLDQANDGPGNGYVGSVSQTAQTFTAGRTGILDRVELNGFVIAGGQVTIQITAVDQDGRPAGPALASGSFNADELPPQGDSSGGGWVSVSFDPGVAVVAGTQYAIVKPVSASNQFLWTTTYGFGDTYPLGRPFTALGFEDDFRFRTYVLSPIPYCNGLEATIYVKNGKIVGGPNDGAAYTGTLAGTSRNDVIVGTDAADAIDGKAGNDTICGLGGKDSIEGAAGNDVMVGGPGADKLNGASGTDSTPDFNASEGDKRTNVP